MLHLLIFSASLSTVQPATAPAAGFDVDTAITRHFAADDDEEGAQWLLPALIDLPAEEEGAELKLRGRKVKLKVPI